MRVAVTQRHLRLAPTDVELLVGSNSTISVVSGTEAHEEYAISDLLGWQFRKDGTRCELKIEHTSFPSGTSVGFGCTPQDGQALTTALMALAPDLRREAPSLVASRLPKRHAVKAHSGPSSVDVPQRVAKGRQSQPKPVVERVFAVEQLMVKSFANAPKRLLLGIGPDGLVVFTGGADSRVVEQFGLERIYSWNCRVGRDFTVLIQSPASSEQRQSQRYAYGCSGSDSDTDEGIGEMQRISLRCKESETVSAMLDRWTGNGVQPLSVPSKLPLSQQSGVGVPRSVNAVGGSTVHAKPNQAMSSDALHRSAELQSRVASSQSRLAKLRAARRGDGEDRG